MKILPYIVAILITGCNATPKELEDEQAESVRNRPAASAEPIGDVTSALTGTAHTLPIRKHVTSTSGWAVFDNGQEAPNGCARFNNRSDCLISSQFGNDNLSFAHELGWPNRLVGDTPGTQFITVDPAVGCASAPATIKGIEMQVSAYTNWGVQNTRNHVSLYMFYPNSTLINEERILSSAVPNQNVWLTNVSAPFTKEPLGQPISKSQVCGTDGQRLQFAFNADDFAADYPASDPTDWIVLGDAFFYAIW